MPAIKAVLNAFLLPGHLSAIQKWGGKTSDYAKSGGARTENSWQVQVILAKIQQKWGGSSSPCPPVDKCPAIDPRYFYYGKDIEQ